MMPTSTNYEQGNFFHYEKILKLVEKIEIRFQCKRTTHTIGDETTSILIYLSNIWMPQIFTNMLGNYKESIIGNLCLDVLNTHGHGFIMQDGNVLECDLAQTLHFLRRYG